jgi:hypothetical protein
MRFNISFTWDEWWPLLISDDPQFPDYFAIGIGPIYLELYWGHGLAFWEQ